MVFSNHLITPQVAAKDYLASKHFDSLTVPLLYHKLRSKLKKAMVFTILHLSGMCYLAEASKQPLSQPHCTPSPVNDVKENGTIRKQGLRHNQETDKESPVTQCHLTD